MESVLVTDQVENISETYMSALDAKSKIKIIE